MPMPMPPMSRQKVRSHTPNARPEPNALVRNMTAPISMTFRRPNRSLRVPARIAPKAHPSRAIATTKPVITSFRAKSDSMESTAPLITDESKPNRKPPTAAAIDRAMARRPYELLKENPAVGVEPDDITAVTLDLCAPPCTAPCGA